MGHDLRFAIPTYLRRSVYESLVRSRCSTSESDVKPIYAPREAILVTREEVGRPDSREVGEII